MTRKLHRISRGLGLAVGLALVAVLLILPQAAFAAVTWTNTLPAPGVTYHTLPSSLSIDLFGTAVDRYSATYSFDAAAYKPMTVTVKAAGGHWVLVETLQPDGFT